MKLDLDELQKYLAPDLARYCLCDDPIVGINHRCGVCAREYDGDMRHTGRLLRTLLREARVARELEEAIKEVGMNTIGTYHTNNNVSGYFRLTLERVAKIREGGT